jgi:hypothetical protein
MGPVGEVFGKLKLLLSGVWWVFPFLVVGFGYMSEDMRAAVGGEMGINLYKFLFMQLVLCVIWLLSAFFHATNGNAPVSNLKFDAALSNTVQLGLVGASIWYLALGQLPWALVLPTIAAILDAYITSDRAINTAAFKPIVQQQNTIK